MSRVPLCCALALVLGLGLLVFFLDHQAGSLARERDAAQAEATELRRALHSRDTVIQTLEEQAALSDVLLRDLVRDHQALEADYEEKDRRSGQAQQQDPDFAAWAAAPLPRQLRAGSGLLGQGSGDRDRVRAPVSDAAGCPAGSDPASRVAR